MSSKRLCWLVLVLLPVLAMAADDSAVVQGSITLGGMTLQFKAPKQVKAYEKAVVRYNFVGQGDVCIQAVATNDPAYEQYFDTSIPHSVRGRVDYLAEYTSGNDKRTKFRVTNIGDTIWKATGYGAVTLLNAASDAFLAKDIAPGESFEIDLSADVFRHREPDDVEEERAARGEESPKDVRIIGFQLGYGDSYGSLRPDITISTAFSPTEVGGYRVAAENFRTYPRHPALDEFGSAFYWKNNRGKKSGNLTVEIPPWADRLVVSLIREGARKAVVIPISPSPEGLKITRAPNDRWTLNGKPIVLVRCRRDGLAKAKEMYGGDNIVVLDGGIGNNPQRGPNLDYFKEAQKYGIKCFPSSLCYVRLQWVGRAMGVELMPGRMGENENERVDALDPNFPKAYADYVDRVIREAGDYLYRTADGKIPIGLCDEAQYGYPWGFGYPTRWGGQTPADVAAFRLWLKEKYGRIEKLNARWKTEYAEFEEIDPSPICEMWPRDYPDPWKEWSPALDDFDRFRSKIHNDMWRKTFAEIKKRHPDVILGLNFYTDFASDAECIYDGLWNWGTGVNWSARRTAVLPEDLDYLDFVLCWNTNTPEAARANINYWKKKGVDVIMFARHYGHGELNETDEFYLPQIDSGGRGGLIIYNHNTALYPAMLATVEEGGIPALFQDWTLGATIGSVEMAETVLFNQELARLAAESAGK